jgi:hypothetical protein
LRDSTIVDVVVTDDELEAKLYQDMLAASEIPAQVWAVEDPWLTNVIRQIAQPRYRVVVPAACAEQAASLIAEQRRAMPMTAPTVSSPTQELVMDGPIGALFESELEGEAITYHALLAAAHIPSQIQVVEEPQSTISIRQIAQPRYRVVVPEDSIKRVQELDIKVYRGTESDAQEELDTDEPQSILVIGRLIIWLLLAATIVTLVWKLGIPFACGLAN